MKMSIRTMFFACLILMMLVVSGGTALAIEAWDGNLTLNGYLQNDSAWRLEDGAYNLHGPTDWNTAKGLKKGDWVLNRTSLMLEARWKLSDNLAFTCLYRGSYEASLHLDSDLEQHFLDSNFGSDARMHDYIYQSDVREIYADITWGDWAARIGKQQIVWGEAMGFRMSDVINPLDYSWNYFYPSWEEIRKPLWGIDLTRRFGDKAALELVYLPGAFDNGFDGTVYGIAGTHWAPGTYQPGFLDNIAYAEPENDLDNSEFGARLKLRIGAWDTSLFYFYSRHDNIILKKDWVTRLTWPPTGEAIYDFPFSPKVGGTFNVYSSALDAVVRGECVYTFDEPYHSNALQFVLPMNRFESDNFAYMLAIDKLIKVPFINERNFIFVSSQFAQKFIFDHDDEMDTPDTDDEDSHTIWTIYMSTQYMYEKLTPSIFFMYNFSGEYIINPQVTYAIDDYWSIGLGAQFIEADSLADPFFGLFEDNDQVYAFVKFGF